jgi:hypothetical protein
MRQIAGLALIALTVFAASACGRLEKHGASMSQASPADTGNGSGSGTTTSTATGLGTTTKVPYTEALTDTAALPACSSSNVDQLIYVKQPGEFYDCDGTSWSQISIAGPAGPTGATGPAGVSTPLPTNEWLDPITNMTWLVGGTGDWPAASQTCSGSFRLPTAAEGDQAGDDGIQTVAYAHAVDMWTSTVDSGTSTCNLDTLYHTIDTFNAALSGGYDDCATHGIYCVKTK